LIREVEQRSTHNEQ